jgi:epoxyqueuosine reductase
MTLTDRIKDYALEIGYSRVGITTADDFTQFADILTQRGDYYDFWTQGAFQPLDAASPKKLLPNAKSIIVLIFDYAQRAFAPQLNALMGRVYQARCYFAPPTNINGARLTLVKDFLSQQSITYVDNPWLPQRWAAARAGVATFGKNTCAYVDGIGSFILISTLVVDAELQYDQPTLESKCPANCTKCIDACPTQALYEPFKLNPRRCIPFNNWMTTDERGFGISSKVPRELRSKMDQRIHGCDACQEACPRNHKKLTGSFPSDAFLDTVAPDLNLDDILHLTTDYYESRVKPLMYNYIRDTRLFQRNAAIAIGNTHDPRYLPDLAQEINNNTAFIRSHVAWALGQIGGADARTILQTRLLQETDTNVREEIEQALHG